MQVPALALVLVLPDSQPARPPVRLRHQNIRLLASPQIRCRCLAFTFIIIIIIIHHSKLQSVDLVANLQAPGGRFCLYFG